MDFTLTPEQTVLPRRGPRLAREADLPKDWVARLRRGSDIPRPEAYEFLRQWQRQMYEAGFVGLTWPKDSGGRGLTFMEEMILQQEMALAKAPPGAQHPRHRHGRAHHHRLRHRGAEEALPAQDALLRGDLVPGLLGAQRGLGPGLAPDPRGEGRRPLRGQRPEGVDVARPHGRLDDAAGAHRPRGAQAQGHHLLPARHEEPRRHREAAQADHRRRRVQRGLLRQRPRATSRRSWAASTTAGRSGSPR